MNKFFASLGLVLLCSSASAETYDECIARVLEAQTKCETPCSKSAEACRSCNEDVNRMQKRCEERAKKN